MSISIETYAIAVGKSKAYTDAVFAAFPKGIHLLGEVDYYSDLPSNPSEGDAYTVKYTGTSGTEIDGTEYAWAINPTTQAGGWVAVGPDMSKYQTNLTDAPGYDATKVQVLTNNLGTLTWVEGTTFAALNNTQYGGAETT